MVLVPMDAMFFSTVWREPSPSATTDTTEAMPMMMPSMVRKVRRRWAFMATSAIRNASRKRSAHEPRALRLAISAGRCNWAGAGASARRRSAVMRPSLISMMRWACSATPMSCVTMMTVWPSACSSSRIFSTSAPEAVSSAPVGSSARITLPPFISARAMDTRCCCPPESLPGVWPRRSARPSRCSRACERALRWSRGVPAYTAGTSTLPRAVRSGSRW